MTPQSISVLLLLCAALVLSSCDGEADPVRVNQITMSELKFTPSEASVAARSTIAIRNDGSVGHDLKLRQDGREVGGTLVLNPGETQKLEVLYPSGTYEMYCSVPGHEESGMKGTLTVD